MTLAEILNTRILRHNGGTIREFFGGHIFREDANWPKDGEAKREMSRYREEDDEIRPPGREGGIKIWLFFVFLASLFAAHYKLIDLRYEAAKHDIETQIAIALSKGDNRYDLLTVRVASLEAERLALLTRLTALENQAQENERRHVRFEINQTNVMRRLNMNP